MTTRRDALRTLSILIPTVSLAKATEPQAKGSSVDGGAGLTLGDVVLYDINDKEIHRYEGSRCRTVGMGETIEITYGIHVY